MHTIKGNPFTTFHLNGDFTGDVTIVRHEDTPLEETMTLPMDALDALFAEKLRRTKISLIEQMSDQGILHKIAEAL